VTSFDLIVNLSLFIKSWADAHANLPRPGKVDRESGCGFQRSNQAGTASALSETEGFLFSESTLPASLVRAYRETHYKVFAATGTEAIAFTLLIDQACVELSAAHRRHGADCSAYITACNPYSQSLRPDENAKRQGELARELRSRDLAFDDGAGHHPSNGWEGGLGEPSYLVYGLGLDAAKALARQFEQNAFVFSGIDAVPRLILLR
jgi:Protein of unknown function (DUF3293)